MYFVLIVVQLYFHSASVEFHSAIQFMKSQEEAALNVSGHLSRCASGLRPDISVTPVVLTGLICSNCKPQVRAAQ